MGGHEDHAEGATMTVKVVASMGGTEHRRRFDQPILHVRRGHGMAVARDGVPNEAVRPPKFEHVDEDATVAAVEGARVAAVGARVREVGHRRCGDEAGRGASLEDLEPVEEAEEGRGPVEGAVAAEEPGVAEDAEPRLADERGAEEVLGLVRREAEEDLGHDVVDQRQRRAWRRHGACARVGGGGEGLGGGLDWGKSRSETVTKALFSSSRKPKSFQDSPVTSNLVSHAWNIKYKRKQKLITQFSYKSQDESFNPS